MTDQNRGKYADLIDAEVWAFIDKTYNCYPADTASRSIAEQREIYDAMCEIFDAGRPEAVSTEDSTIDAVTHKIPIRQYVCSSNSSNSSADSSASAQVVYYHGGGFVVGGLESHDSICAEICACTGLAVTAVDYRLAPEHKYPSAHQDALTCYQAIADASDTPIILVGDSAGGNLAASVAHASRNLPQKQRPLGQVLIYPGLSPEIDLPSYTEHANAPMLTTEEILLYKEAISDSEKNHENPDTDTVSRAPLSDVDFSGLPITYIFPAQCDPLASDGEHYANKINQAGGKAINKVHIGLVHGHLRGRHSSKAIAQSFTDIIEAINAIAEQK